ncbi:MAG TPA: hypothetical protein VEJ36_05140 [Nitrososphaerales archaeon]|nr:hypothetical protein [Nitrososphaerales archaeon]
MKEKFELVSKLRRVFMNMRQGLGLAHSLVETFRDSEGGHTEVARRILLGIPPAVALESLTSAGSEELRMLVNLLAGAGGASARLVGEKGERLSGIVEGWLEAQESSQLERRVMHTRGLIMCTVLGAVVAMMATIGPLVGVEQISTAAVPVASRALLELSSCLMAALSGGMLGAFTGGKRLYQNVILTVAAFVITSSAVAPLANLPAV